MQAGPALQGLGPWARLSPHSVQATAAWRRVASRALLWGSCLTLATLGEGDKMRSCCSLIAQGVVGEEGEEGAAVSWIVSALDGDWQEGFAVTAFEGCAARSACQKISITNKPSNHFSVYPPLLLLLSITMTNVWIAAVLVAVVACSATVVAGVGAASAGTAPEQLHIALRGQVNQQNGVLCVTIHVSTTSHSLSLLSLAGL